ncbi:probable cytochrome P450 12a5, mitochondrial isoform X2 [Orussus abietinus]|uniref:probable cytochrome P450 12a5, mitochondrial isoform X2 n=1 Tax=Orussus abietinus TaxID=222816 RepID=UPI0006263046|nr:probable cytochrome P450 12a5, mitochondrial isoform X2 [Orussus abietinus]
MIRLIPRCGIPLRKAAFSIDGCEARRRLSKLTSPLEVKRQESLQLTKTGALSATMAQPQPAPSLQGNPITRSESLRLLDSTSADISDTFDTPETKILQEVSVDKSPLPFEEIPGPAILKFWEKYWKYVPLLGQLHWNRNVTPMRYLFNHYGPVVRINGPMIGDVVMIHRPEHIAEVFKQEGQSPLRSGVDILQHYRLHHRKYRFPGPFNMAGAEWLETKAKIEKPLGEQLSSHFGKLEMVCDELAQRIRRIRNRQDEVHATFIQDLTRWGMECFSTLMFNKRLGFLEPAGFNSSSESARIVEALGAAHVYLARCETGFQVWRFVETPYSRRLFQACDVIDGVLGKYIRQAQRKLRILASGVQEEKVEEEGSPILEKLILDLHVHPDDVSTLLMDMIILGVQATANCQAFLLYFLAKNPRAQRTLYEEICGIMPTRGSALSEQALKKLPYLEACLKESLRLRPLFPYLTRILQKTITLHGYTIPKGTYLIMANEISASREENFEDPEKFKPERWLSDNTQDNFNQKFGCLPFGHGPRSCLGKNMAETEIMLLTTKLVREFRIEYDYADIGSNYLMVSVPDRPLRFRFVDRD